MKRNFSIVLVLVLIGALLGSWSSALAGRPLWRTLEARANKLDPAVQTQLSTLQADQMTTVIVTLRQQADLSRLHSADHEKRDRDVVLALQATANGTQAKLKRLLTLRHGQSKVKDFQSLWIVNGFSLTASAEVIRELAKHADVLSITPDETDIIPSVLAAPEANLTLTNAPALWDSGNTGQGIVVASLDSGVDVSHPDLAARWRGGTNSWFDPYGQHPTTPVDLTGHGTQTMGVIVGGDAGGTTIGMAPGAQWIAVRIFNDQGSATATAIHQGFQWLLDPDGDPATSDAPRVVNNSWTYGTPGCSLEFEPDLQALRAAGILPVFAAGNSGPYSNTSYSPANNPSAFAVGAINNTSGIYGYSSRGPSTCGGGTSVFPDLVAPGVNVRTSDLYAGYYSASGTSLAAPHVAGALALLLVAYPGLTADQQESALLNSAFDLGAAGPDNSYGYGRLDVSAAFTWLASAPTATPTSLPTDTPTPEPPTATPTALPPTETPTTLPPTDTSTPTAVQPTNTPTALPPTATYTALPPTSTGYLPPSANSPVTSSAGDNNGYQTNPANVYINDSVFAVDTNSGSGTSTSYTSGQKDKHLLYNYNFNLPPTAIIKGIQVQLDAKADSTSSSPKIYVQLSWNGGASWTTAFSTTNLTTGEITYTLGSATNTWGRTWTAADFSNANFRVRVIDVASNTSRDFSLDYLAVNVSYQP